MATLSTGYTWQSGDTVTPGLLNQTVNSATVSSIVNADVANNAAIALGKLATGALPSGISVAAANVVDGSITDAKLATISTAGKVSNSATTATSANTANAIVARNASGNFSAGTITANLTGTASAIADGTVSTAKIVDGNVTTAKLATATQQSLIPAGAVMPFAMNSAPSGWLAADGTAVSRSTYAALFAAIGVTHGVGDGSTTFNLPDLRGIFVRGSGSQTISGTTYSGTFAAKQQDALESHSHTGTTSSNGNHSHTVTFGVTGGPTGVGGQGTGAIGVVSTTENGNHSHTFTTNSTGSTETRPANIALLYCVKF